MRMIKLISLLYLIIINICLTTTLTCYNTGNFSANSAYSRNLNITFSSLPANVSSNAGYYNITMGQEPDKVYALGLCRADSPSDNCSTCISSRIEELRTQCPIQKEAYAWGGDPHCKVRYASHSIFGQLELSPEDARYKIGDNITSDLDQFDQIWGDLMDGLVTKASMGSSTLKFATGEANFTRFDKIYAFLQCSPDLSQINCDYCLRYVVSSYNRLFHGKQGGIVHVPSCYFRWDLFLFYNSVVVAPPSSPLPPFSISPPPVTSRKDGEGIEPRAVEVVVVPIVSFLVLAGIICLLIQRRTRKQDFKIVEDVNEIEGDESLQFDFATIKLATDDFSDDNKLGQGGFGAVYKGKLPNGQNIAVKRLSQNSGQGDLEFKNEVLLVARLQHRNLVRLLGFCLEGKERLLMYEFVPNASLDKFLFDPEKRSQLDWRIRYKIIGGIARGLLYLHEDSRLRIIHRDIKASNILLDDELNPKISDFGMAKLFAVDQTQADTNRIVGTYGYMAPEYAIRGQFSVKSDVYSFGVLILEIITSQKSYSSRINLEGGDLLTNVWRNWREGTALNLIDPSLREGSRSEMMRCIHVGLLCVQENVASRPTMASVVLMLSSCSLSLPLPSQPAFAMYSTTDSEALYLEPTSSDQSKSDNVHYSLNEASITELEPR